MITADNKTEEEKPSFDELPLVIRQLASDMQKIIEHITVINKEICRLKGETKVWLTVDALIEYLPTHPVKQTVYGWMSRREIPYYKGEKTTLFLKSDIDEWMSVRHVVPDWWNDRTKFLIDSEI